MGKKIFMEFFWKIGNVLYIKKISGKNYEKNSEIN